MRARSSDGRFGDFEVLSASPPLAGAGLIQQLQIAEAAGIGSTAPGSAEFAAIQSRAWQTAEQSVLALDDPALGPVPTEQLTDPAANAALTAGSAATSAGARTVTSAVDPRRTGGFALIE